MTAAISTRINAMRQIGRDVDILAINARLIAAGMGQAGADFLSFAAEIRKSAAQVQVSLERIGQELSDVGRQLEAARGGVMAYADRHGVTLRTIPQRLSVAVATIAAHDRLADAAAAAVAGHTADVHRQVGGMIVELQLGDITRQRIEHMQDVARTLLCLASPAAIAQSEWRTQPAGEVAGLLRTGCTLVAAQLQDTAGELDREAERVANGLSRLAAAARDISRLGEQAYGGADQHHHGFMAELEVELRDTETLFEGLRAARADTDRRIGNVLTVAHRLTENIGTLCGLEADIRIMGLNTTLKCGRLGVLGRPLSVIAQALRDCGGRTASHADAALADLNRLADVASTFSASREEAPGASGGDFTRGLLGAVELLGATGRALSGALAELDDESGAASELLQQAARDFSVRHDIGEVLHSGADELGRIATLQAGQATTDTAATQHLLAGFAAVYTMAREREVHTRFGGPSARPPPPQAETDLADVLF